MTTMTIQIENPSLVDGLKKILGALEGVTILESAKRSKKSIELVPTPETLSAMEEVKTGKNAGTVSLDSVDRFIASMQ